MLQVNIAIHACHGKFKELISINKPHPFNKQHKLQ